MNSFGVVLNGGAPKASVRFPLASLPDDLLLIIFMMVDFKDARALTTVNCRFRDLAERSLYRSLRFSWTRQITPPMFLLLRTLRSRPELGCYIQDIGIHGDDFFDDERVQAPCLPLPTEKGLDPVLALSQRFGPSSRFCPFQSGLLQGNMAALIALLLAYTPAIRRFSLGLNASLDWDIVQALFETILSGRQCSLASFGRLRTVAIPDRQVSLWNREAVSRADSLCLFHLPQARSLQLALSPDDEAELLSWPREAPDLEYLTELDLSTVSVRSLGRVLAATNSLERLTWTWMGLMPNPPGPEELVRLDLGRLGRALSRVRNTLVSLDIRIPYDLEEGEIQDPEDVLKGSFSAVGSLTSLRLLSIPAAFVVRNDLIAWTSDLVVSFPPSLEHLRLADDIALSLMPGLPDEGLPALLALQRGFNDHNLRREIPQLLSICLFFQGSARGLHFAMWLYTPDTFVDLQRHGIDVEVDSPWVKAHLPGYVDSEDEEDDALVVVEEEVNEGREQESLEGEGKDVWTKADEAGYDADMESEADEVSGMENYS